MSWRLSQPGGEGLRGEGGRPGAEAAPRVLRHEERREDRHDAGQGVG